MRHPVAEEIAAASGDDGEPVSRVFLEHRAFERIELVTDEDGDGHLEPLTFAVIACDKRRAFAQGSDSDEAIHPSAGRDGLLRFARNDVPKLQF